MAICSRDDAELNKFVEDKNGDVAVRAVDVCTHDKLDDIIQAVGGVTNTDPTIYNVSVLAATEVSQALPANTTKFLIRSRECGDIQFAYEATETATNFLTIPAGASFEDDSFYKDSRTIYFQSSKADTIEIVAFAND